MCQEVNGEPPERLGLAEMTKRNFKRIHVPVRFELMSSLREALSQIVRAFGGQKCLHPKGLDERILDQRANAVGDSITKSRKRAVIEYCAFFKGKRKRVLIASQVSEFDLCTRPIGNRD